MLSRHIRIATALIVSSLVLAPAAQATKNDHRFQQWVKSHDHAVTCSNLRDLANSDSDTAANAYAKGDKATGDEYSKHADQDYQTAHDAQCGWASRRVPPKRYRPTPPTTAPVQATDGGSGSTAPSGGDGSTGAAPAGDAGTTTTTGDSQPTATSGGSQSAGATARGSDSWSYASASPGSTG